MLAYGPSMTVLRFVTGDATEPDGVDPAVIVHVCNDVGAWGAGFVLAVSKRWPAPERQYREWHRSGEGFTLGAVQFVAVEPAGRARPLWVANLVGQHGLHHEPDGTPPVRYEAIRAGLGQVAEFALGEPAGVHMPRIGAGLAGGDWPTIEDIVTEQLVDAGVRVTVYDWAADLTARRQSSP